MAWRPGFQTAINSFAALSSVVDDEDEPYKSKYEARRVLVSRAPRIGVQCTGVTGGCSVWFSCAPPLLPCLVPQTAARADLKAALTLSSVQKEASDIEDAIVGCDRRLGINYILTEENQSKGLFAPSIACGAQPS